MILKRKNTEAIPAVQSGFDRGGALEVLKGCVDPGVLNAAESLSESFQGMNFKAEDFVEAGAEQGETFDAAIIGPAMEKGLQEPVGVRFLETGKYLQHKSYRRAAEVMFAAGVLNEMAPMRCIDHLAQINSAGMQWNRARLAYNFLISNDAPNFYHAWAGTVACAMAGHPQEAIELIGTSVGVSITDQHQKRVLPFLALHTYAKGDADGLEALLKDNDGSFVKGLPQWVVDRVQKATNKILPSVTGLPVSKINAMLTSLETGLETEFNSPEIWDGLSDAYPKNVKFVTAYVNGNLASNKAALKPEKLTIFRNTKKLSEDALVAGLAGNLKLNFVDDAQYILFKQKLSPAKLHTVFERLVSEYGPNTSTLSLLDQVSAQNKGDDDLVLMNGRLASELGHQKRAEECLWPLFQARNAKLTAQDRYRLGVASQMANKPAQALTVLETIANTDTVWDDASRLISRIAYQTTDFDTATVSSHQRLSQNLDSVDDLKDLLFAYRATAQHADASFVAKELLDHAGGDEDEYLKALTLLVTEAALSSDAKWIAEAQAAVDDDKALPRSGWTRTWVFIAYNLMLGNVERASEIATAYYRRNRKNQIAILTAEWLRNLGGIEDEGDLSTQIIDDFEREAMEKLRGGFSGQFHGQTPSDFDLSDIVGGPRITIVVPCYNEARFLADCLNSVWQQCYPFWECIIVDDVGSDTSTEIAMNYVRADKRFKYVRNAENLGLAGSRNTGLEHARAPYVTFLDSDDYLTVDSILFRYRSLANSTKANVVGTYCMIKHVDEHDLGSPIRAAEPAPTNVIKSYVSSGFEAPFNAHAPILRTDILRALGGFTGSMRMGAEDWDCWGRVMRAGYSFIPTRRVGGFYRQKRGSMVRSLSKFHIAEAENMYRRASEYQDIPAKAAFFKFTYPVWVYQGVEKFYFRALRFAAMAHMAGDMDGFSEIITKLPGSLAMVEALNINPKVFVTQGVQRFLSTSDETIGDADRDLYKKQSVNEITAKIESYLEGRDPETNMEEFFPVLAGKKTSKGKAKKSGRAKNITTLGVPAYVRLEESNTHLADEERIRELHNIHAGERCFIVGNGPSLNKMDLGLLKNEISFAVNGIFYKTRELGYKPNYYMVEDTSVMKENIQDIIDYEVEKKFFPTIYSHLHPHDDNTYFFNMNRGFYERKSPNYCVPRFSTDFSKRGYCGQSVTMLNLQLAYYMGFHEVYLVGMDFSYIIPKEFERKGDIIVSTDDDPNHFHPDYFGKGKSWKDPKLDRVLANYRMAKLAYETSGRHIYNATVGGRLEEFPRADFAGLFKK